MESAAEKKRRRNRESAEISRHRNDHRNVMIEKDVAEKRAENLQLRNKLRSHYHYLKALAAEIEKQTNSPREAANQFPDLYLALNATERVMSECVGTFGGRNN